MSFAIPGYLQISSDLQLSVLQISKNKLTIESETAKFRSKLENVKIISKNGITQIQVKNQPSVFTSPYIQPIIELLTNQIHPKQIEFITKCRNGNTIEVAENWVKINQEKVKYIDVESYEYHAIDYTLKFNTKKENYKIQFTDFLIAHICNYLVKNVYDANQKEQEEQKIEFKEMKPIPRKPDPYAEINTKQTQMDENFSQMLQNLKQIKLREVEALQKQIDLLSSKIESRSQISSLEQSKNTQSQMTISKHTQRIQEYKQNSPKFDQLSYMQGVVQKNDRKKDFDSINESVSQSKIQKDFVISKAPQQLAVSTTNFEKIENKAPEKSVTEKIVIDKIDTLDQKVISNKSELKMSDFKPVENVKKENEVVGQQDVTQQNIDNNQIVTQAIQEVKDKKSENQKEINVQNKEITIQDQNSTITNQEQLEQKTEIDKQLITKTEDTQKAKQDVCELKVESPKVELKIKEQPKVESVVEQKINIEPPKPETIVEQVKVSKEPSKTPVQAAEQEVKLEKEAVTSKVEPVVDYLVKQQELVSILQTFSSQAINVSDLKSIFLRLTFVNKQLQLHYGTKLDFKFSEKCVIFISQVFVYESIQSIQQTRFNLEIEPRDSFDLAINDYCEISETTDKKLLKQIDKINALIPNQHVIELIGKDSKNKPVQFSFIVDNSSEFTHIFKLTFEIQHQTPFKDKIEPEPEQEEKKKRTPEEKAERKRLKALKLLEEEQKAQNQLKQEPVLNLKEDKIKKENQIEQNEETQPEIFEPEESTGEKKKKTPEEKAEKKRLKELALKEQAEKEAAERTQNETKIQEEQKQEEGEEKKKRTPEEKAERKRLKELALKEQAEKEAEAQNEVKIQELQQGEEGEGEEKKKRTPEEKAERKRLKALKLLEQQKLEEKQQETTQNQEAEENTEVSDTKKKKRTPEEKEERKRQKLAKLQQQGDTVVGPRNAFLNQEEE
ncbi:Hypothetical_protein [Hexamita inflata]|uniref:Hypothetical_protein n=1 Tax=Hexamita inflata TaxID=28002 RepID=A0AA86PGH4_9EUKA|nr:Hypothetical protein HINF_LOCUS25466 [Hexamita inflata]